MKWLTALVLSLTVSTSTTTGEPVMLQTIEKVDKMGTEQNIDNITRKIYLQYIAAKTVDDKKALLKSYARSIAEQKFGWSKSQFDLIDSIWTQESQWNPRAINKKSGAWGIAQMLTKTQPKNPFKQINLGLKYINHKYDNPEAAKAHKDEFGWY